MDTANVIPLDAPQAIRGVRNRRPVALIPVRVRFDAFELDEPNARLLRDGRAVMIPPKPFEVLCALARSPGCLVTKNALLEAVWGHRFVSESALKTAISEVRAVLDDDPRRPRHIETVSRRGYRFIAAVVSDPMQATTESGRKDAGLAGQPALAALAALCRGNAALAGLIRALADTLAHERFASTVSGAAGRP
jgi:DNA-binding winged helix-turn-helix (wHTH) protein